MRQTTRFLILGTTLLFSVLTFGLAWLAQSAWLSAGGAVGLVFVLWQVARLHKAAAERASRKPVPLPTPRRPAVSRPAIQPSDTDGLVERMLVQGRYALLLRPKIVANLTEDHLRRAQAALEQSMALVPDGEVMLGQADQSLDDDPCADEPTASPQGRLIRVERFFLDRYPVTNREYYEFVVDGGYEQVQLWDKSIWAAVLDMVDQTGAPGPRWWKDGFYLEGQENHPVVGVSWHEASAYARWLGKRLPTDAEWVKAGSWPIPLSGRARMQRRFPWGDTMDRTRANLWSPSSKGMVPVDQFAGGVSVGGVYQLIGNVWEWTSGDFRAADYRAGRLDLSTPMKSIRGGAFDTYFDNQATCQFQSGENPLGRRHNIGLRCAVGICDLVLTLQAAAATEPAERDLAGEEPAAMTEEVHV